jgi:hypothetical protein
MFFILRVAMLMDRKRAASARPFLAAEGRNLCGLTAGLHTAAPPVGREFSSFFFLRAAIRME